MTRTLRYPPAKKSRLELARSELFEVAAILRSQGHPLTARRIEDIVGELMFRKYGTRKPAKPRYPEPTAAVVRSVNRFKNSGLQQWEIGALAHCGAGRVSEIFKGLRTEDEPGGTAELKALKAKKANCGPL